MDIFGIGIMEVMVIVLVAVIVLGPARAAEMARNAGKMLREVRRSFSDLSSTLEEQGRWDSAEGRPSGGKDPEPGSEGAAEAARTAGKMLRDVRRSFTDLSASVEEARWDRPAQRPARSGDTDSGSEGKAKS